jgi:cytochrome P450
MFASVEFKANPYPTYNRLRSRGPIHWVNSGDGSWLLLNYADVAKALADPRLSSRRSHLMVNRLPTEAQGEFAEFNRLLSMWLQFLDPPKHDHLRKSMEKCFTSEFFHALRSKIEKIANSLLDQVQDKGEMEFISDFAYPLPALVMIEMLGISAANKADFLAWSEDFATFQGPTATLEKARRAQDSLITITKYFRELLIERRKNPGDDLISFLIRIEEQEEFLNAEELLAQCASMLVAGHETTRNLLGNGLLALLQHPNQWEILKHDSSIMANALRELLRYDSPIQFVARTVTEIFDLCDQQIIPGQFVTCVIGSANRDPTKFKDADTLDITRKDCSHLAFGYGAHTCIGAALTYLEAEIAFNTLIKRMPDLRLVNDVPDWNLNVALRALKKLPLNF